MMKVFKSSLRLTHWLLIIALTVAGTITPVGADLSSGTLWNNAVEKIEANLKLSREEEAAVKAEISRDKAQLKAQLKAANEEAFRFESDLARRKKEFNSLLVKEEKLKLAMESENAEIKTMDGTLNSFYKIMDGILKENHVAPHVNNRHASLSLLAPEGFSSMNGVRAVVDLYFEVISLTGKVTRFEGSFSGQNGEAVHGKMMSVGPFTTFYSSDGGDAGFLYPSSDGSKFKQISGDLSGSMKEHVRNSIAGKSDQFPMDISKGAVFRLMKKKRSLIGVLKAGGVMAWPILLIGVVALLLGLERLFRLTRYGKITPGLFEELLSHADTGEYAACRALCLEKLYVPACRVIDNIAAQTAHTKEIIDNAINESVLKELPGLEKHLSTLKILAAVAPLLGLLGTVTGMINTFQVISTFGTGDPRMMSGGISEALITTQLGLAVAVPVLMMHHLLERKSDAMLADMEERGASFASVVLNRNERAVEEKP